MSKGKSSAKEHVARKSTTSVGHQVQAIAKPVSIEAKPIRVRKGGQVVLLSGGNPQIAQGYGDAPMQAYIAAMPGWKSDLGRRLDALIMRTVPGEGS